MATKTIGEHIADLENTRAAKAGRIDEIVKATTGSGKTMESHEQEEFDTLDAEIKAVDEDLKRMRRAEELAGQKATPVKGKDEREAGKARAGVVEVKNADKVDSGIGFARLARVKALAHLGMVNGIRDELSVAKAVYPNDESLIETIQKATVNAANTLTGNGTWAGNLVNEGGAAFADFVEYLRPRTLLGQIGDRLRRLPFDTPVLVQGSGGTGAWVKEGAAKPLTKWTYTRTKLAPLKVAAIAVATKETLMRASIAADTLLRDELARAIGATIDTTFISDDAGVTDTSPAGVRYNIAAASLSGGTTVQDIRCDIATFLTAFADANLSLSGAAWIMPERVAIALSLIANEVGATAFPGITPNGGTFAGLPVFVSSYADTDSNGSVVALVKLDDIFLGDEGGVQVSMSDQASLLMTDDAQANMNSTTPTTAQVVSLWQTNSVGFLVERFVNWQLRRADAVVWARVNWTACGS
jgi:HK97 family phage major capsid protein